MIAAVCQMNSGPDRTENLAQALYLVEHAAGRGAELIALPENFELMASPSEKLAQADVPGGETLRPLRELALGRKLTVIAGSFAERSDLPGKIYNCSVVIGPTGELLGSYRKIHLFDVEIGDGANYRESEIVAPGQAAVTVDTAAGRVGLSVCYDLRFPELYRTLVERGAEILSVPAAFTQKTGMAHWEVLLRARAIENQCFVLAAAQVGVHPGKRVTYGHSMIVDPWGTVLACCADGPGVAVAEIDREALLAVRRSLPALQHRRARFD